jgi:GH18 family chitinase
MLSVGEISFERTTFGDMLLTQRSRDHFVASALDICDAFDFDGIDIDFEFNSYQNQFISLLKELRTEAKRRFRDHFIISIAIGTPLIISMSSREIPLIAEYFNQSIN